MKNLSIHSAKKSASLITSFVTLACLLICLAGGLMGCQKTKLTAVVIDIDLTSEEYAFGVDKDQPELLAKANEFIAKIMADGTFDDICNHYFGDGDPVAVATAQLDTNKDQLVVATNLEFEPFEFKKGNKIYGIDMEIAAAFAEFLGKELVIQNMDFDSVCLSVGEHKCDIAMAGLTVNETRKESVAFTASYYNASQKLIVKSDCELFKNCKTAADMEAVLKTLTDAKVASQSGTTGQFYVKGDEDWGFDGFSNLTFKGYANGALAITDMLNGNIDFVILDAAPALCITEAINALQ